MQGGSLDPDRPDKLDYQLSCHAEVENPTIRIAGDPNQWDRGPAPFDRSYSFIARRIGFADGEQWLGGIRISGAGRQSRGATGTPPTDGVDFHVRAAEWNCRLFRGGEPYPG